MRASLSFFESLEKRAFVRTAERKINGAAAKWMRNELEFLSLFRYRTYRDSRFIQDTIRMSAKNMHRVKSTQAYLRDIPDLFKVMRLQEDTVYTCPDYLAEEFQCKLMEDASTNKHNFFPSRILSTLCTEIDPDWQWREKICEWYYQVVDHFDYNRQVVAIAMNYFDRYLALRPVNREIFQLAGMTCLYIAIKHNQATVLSLDAFISLTSGQFQEQQLKEMEVAIFTALAWLVNPPTPLLQAKYLMFILPEHVPRKNEIWEITRFLTEHSVCDYFYVAHKMSTIALAALYSALDIVGFGEPEVSSSLLPAGTSSSLANTVRLLTGLDPLTEDVYTCMKRMKLSFHQSGFSLSTFDSLSADDDRKCANGSPARVSDRRVF